MQKILVGYDQGSYTVTNGARTITLTGLNFTVGNEQLAYIYNKTQDKMYYAPGVGIALASVSGGVITIDSSFPVLATGDVVHIQLFVTNPGLDITLDATKTLTQNPQYGHYTSVEQVIAESAIKGAQGTGGAGGSTTLLVGTGFTIASGGQAVGYTAYQTTDAASALVSSVDSATNITTATLSGGATWASKAYSLPLVNRYEIPMEGYNNMSMHYYLSNGVGLTAYLKIFETLNSAATTDANTSWVDKTEKLLSTCTGYDGTAKAIKVAASTTVEDIISFPADKTMLKYMLMLVVEYSVGGGTPVNTYNVYIKKSS